MNVGANLVMALALSLAGCADLQDRPNISIVLHGQSIRVLEEGENVPSDCTYLSYVQVTDGLVSTGRWRYLGTKERAILRLQNRAAELDADLVRIDQELTSANPLKYGFEIALNATAYKCSNAQTQVQHSLRTPNNSFQRTSSSSLRSSAAAAELHR